MYKICVFAGTTEGRELISFLCTQPVSVTACVATEYGEQMLPTAENLTVSAKRLPVSEITQMLSETAFDLVIDATHPYAASITESISAACRTTGRNYLRLLREASQVSSDVVYVPDTDSAVAFLSETQGNILLTTGSKELPAYSVLKEFAERVYARVLPMNASLEACRTAGLTASHIIAMQGPFSEEMNLALLRAVSAAWLVTKDGGEPGGFDEKVSASRKAGARLVVIGRPVQKEGVSFSEVVEVLCTQFGCIRKPCVDIVGIGLGNQATMTDEVRRKIKEADCLIGASRMLEAVATPAQCVYAAIAPRDIADFILSHSEYQRFAVAMSGDVGFFSGAKKLIPLLTGCEVNVLPGLSSLVYFCARLKTSYEDIFLTSVHGRRHNIVPDVRAHSRVFVLSGGDYGVRELCRVLTEAGLGHVQVSIGERLSYPDEKITQDRAERLTDGTFDALSVLLIENDAPDAVVTHGLPDMLFQRGGNAEGVVPMTKNEVRAVCLSKLQLTDGSVCWDVGAGTGSVSIEMALQAKRGWVYSIEQKSEAVDLLRRNQDAFWVENLSIVHGHAPEACIDLPAPSHVFVGGSAGNMRAILDLLRRKNPNVRVVATAISLESVAELTACMKDISWKETEVVSIQVSHGRKAGPYHLMTGQNPIYIFTMQGGGEV